MNEKVNRVPPTATGWPGRQFDLADVERAERRNGCWYFVTADGRTMIPATHIGAEYTAHVSVYPATAHFKGWVAWRLNDVRTGEVLIRGTEDFWSHVPRSFIRASRRALEAVRRRGCTVRVKPGDRGPWHALERAS
ncbi:MAG: hypothetical protein GWN84_05315 [Gammaproteobacteria bacterium]|nr:hypothetical protein [Gammaproteobacteria bacterium]NIR82381.1 hypothetical protein [Gammaproteobacteria bacterium]NIU03526.1 hypothetical protein [Gammaproteobacteria bacterium]NIX84800.1 hypothetical protein [Gammaproteobacteria bacterium]